MLCPRPKQPAHGPCPPINPPAARRLRAGAAARVILAGSRAILVGALGILAGTLVLATGPASARVRLMVPEAPTSSVTVTGAALAAIPPSFMGLSMNVEEMQDFTGQAAFPQFVKLIDPSGDGPFVLRLGGTYADSAYWNGETSQIMPQYLAPAADRVTIGNAWLQSLAGVVAGTGSNVIINVNAAAHDPQMALNFIQAAQRELPTGTLSAVAIGNEPNLYPLGYDGITPAIASWVRRFSPVRYDTLFSLYASVLHRHLPSLTLAGPELSMPTAPWLQSLLSNDAGQVGLATEHYYAYNACAAAGSSGYPDLHKYFRATNISQATAVIAGSAAAAHNAGVPYRLTELGSSTCQGLPAVTDTFATSLWGLDQLYELVAAGVNGINFHLRANAPNSAIETVPGGGLQAEPLLYGIAAFTSTLGPGAVLDQVTGVLPSNVKVWAVQSSYGYRLALINDTTERERVDVRLPSAAAMSVRALSAPTPWAQSASFGGQTISGSGTWQGPLRTQTVVPVTGSYWFTIPPDSAEIAATLP